MGLGQSGYKHHNWGRKSAIRNDIIMLTPMDSSQEHIRTRCSRSRSLLRPMTGSARSSPEGGV